jgi:hypothetical protein
MFQAALTLRGHLDIEPATLHRALGQLLATERKKFHDRLERKTGEFEVKLAKLSGALDVLRGAAPLPPAKFPSVKAWKEDTIYHEGDIVAFAGGTFRALRDTARAPGAKDWVCLARPGNTLTIPALTTAMSSTAAWMSSWSTVLPSLR